MPGARDELVQLHAARERAYLERLEAETFVRGLRNSVDDGRARAGRRELTVRERADLDAAITALAPALRRALAVTQRLRSLDGEIAQLTLRIAAERVAP